MRSARERRSARESCSAPISLIANGAWALACAPERLRFRRALDDPGRAQRELLAGYLRANADTDFGRRHGFGAIESVEAWRARVPLSTWDDGADDFRRIADGERGLRTREPVHRLAWSSGSTRAAKLVPYTRGLERELWRALAPWIADLFGRDPSLALGPAFWSVTPKARPALPETRVPTGFDDDVEYLGGAWGRVVERALAVPSSVADAGSVEAAQWATALFLLRARGLRVASVWHPSGLALLLDAIERHADALLRDLADGRIRPVGSADTGASRAGIARLERRLGRNPRRARELERVDLADPRAIWPRLALVSAWCDGHAALSAAELARRLLGVRVQPKGLLATEAFVSLPFGGAHPLAVRSHYFELLDDGGVARGVDELDSRTDIGASFEVVVTTAGGLYRYRTGDRVRIDGFVGRTPSVRFVGRCDRASDRAGEKLSEGFVGETLRALFERERLAPRFALLAPATPEEDGSARVGYALYVELGGPAAESRESHADARRLASLEEQLERALAQNPHYALCVALGQLAPVRVVFVRDGDATWIEAELQRGLRQGDVKPSALAQTAGWSRRFTPAAQGPMDERIGADKRSAGDAKRAGTAESPQSQPSAPRAAQRRRV